METETDTNTIRQAVVAQQLEHLSCKQECVGANPTSGSNTLNMGLSFNGRTPGLHPENVGSIPTSSTNLNAAARNRRSSVRISDLNRAVDTMLDKHYHTHRFTF